MTEVQHRVAKGDELPVDDGRQARLVEPHEHVGEVEVAVHQAGAHVRRAMTVQPLAYRIHAGDLRPRVAGQLRVPVELLAPATHLALCPAVRPTEVGQAHGHMVDAGQRGDCVGHRQAHRVLPRRVVVGRRQAERGVEPVDRLHQVERRPDDVGVGLGGDQPRMRHGGAGERGQHPRLAAHGLVAVGPLVHRRAAQHVGATGPGEPQQHVLGSAGDQLQPGEVPLAEATRVHPPAQDGQVDAGDVEAHADPTTPAPPSMT